MYTNSIDRLHYYGTYASLVKKTIRVKFRQYLMNILITTLDVVVCLPPDLI